MTPSPEELERLIDVLLEEELAGKDATDLTQRVLSRAFPSQQNRAVRATGRPGKLYLWSTLAAAAVVLVAGIWFVLPARYPDPVAEGSYTLERAGALERGSILRTESKGASLNLGGYCSVTVSPNSRLEVEGQPHSERVSLLQGEVRCNVNKGIGNFDVRTPVGIVSVRGTEFVVGLQPKSPDTKAQDFALAVTVLSGKVNVNHNGVDVLLDPGPMRVFGAAVTPPKVVSEDPPPQRLPIEIDGEKNALAHGVVEGIVNTRTDKSLELTSVSGKTETYHPEWQGRVEGGPNREMVSRILQLKIGARVRIHWYVDNKIRIKALEVLQNVEPGKVEGF